jgi:pimeloyl-ACP methyl ester carboxylesterase
MPADTKSPLTHAGDTGQLHEFLRKNKADLRQFRVRGPFAVDLKRDREISVSSTEIVRADLFLSAAPEKSSLIIFLHGHDNTKEIHAVQAAYLASWGMHCLVPQLPNKGPWDANGKILARLANAINLRPEIVDVRIDAKRIILAGHSFGAAAVAIALAERTPVAGAILLDPAVVIKNFPAVLGKIDKPVLLLGADEQVSAARNRGYFFRYIRRGIAEVSIRGAAHEDAQFAESTQVPRDSQVTFASALVSAALSLSVTGKLDYAWASIGTEVKAGEFFRARKK